MDVLAASLTEIPGDAAVVQVGLAGRLLRRGLSILLSRLLRPPCHRQSRRPVTRTDGARPRLLRLNLLQVADGPEGAVKEAGQRSKFQRAAVHGAHLQVLAPPARQSAPASEVRKEKISTQGSSCPESDLARGTWGGTRSPWFLATCPRRRRSCPLVNTEDGLLDFRSAGADAVTTQAAGDGHPGSVADGSFGIRRGLRGLC